LANNHTELSLGKEMEKRGDSTSIDTNASVDEAATGEVDRRSFMNDATTVTMAGGLVAAYGTFAGYAGRFLYPSSSATAWMFVAPAQGIEPGGSVEFETPGGLKIVITRSVNSAPNIAPAEVDFLALSSTCPHLGCRVHWEPQNDRFYCPCHNGAFDAAGKPIAGPPKDADQSLPLYALRIESGMLFIEAPTQQVGGRATGRATAAIDNKPAAEQA
jgi:Rieske Fe-S protein